MICASCQAVGSFTAPVVVIVLFAPGLERPYPLIPAEDYRVCKECEAVFKLITKAAEAHPTTREAGLWTRALIIFTDGNDPMDVTAVREELSATQKSALA